MRSEWKRAVSVSGSGGLPVWEARQTFVLSEEAAWDMLICSSVDRIRAKSCVGSHLSISLRLTSPCCQQPNTLSPV